MARSSDVEYKMRMTQNLKDKIVESAKEHNRSMNADIVARLEDSFKNGSQNDIDFFIRFLEHFVVGRAVDPTSTALVELINGWKTQKEKSNEKN